MLIYGEQLLDIPVLSLQTGAELARTEASIIDPHNLKVVAFYLTGPKLDFTPAILTTDDVREVADIGLIINSSDDFIAPDDLVASKQETIAIDFTPVGLKVVDTEHRKLGKVTRYSVDEDSFIIQQLYVSPPMTKLLSQGDFLVHRNQITAINDTTITVRTPSVKSKSTASAAKAFINPFRQPTRPEAEHVKVKE